MTDEEYVRANWKDVWIGVDGVGELWSAAAELTRERLKQISEVEEEIGWMEADVDHCTERGSSELVPYRTLMRLEGIRNDLLRGMK